MASFLLHLCGHNGTLIGECTVESDYLPRINQTLDLRGFTELSIPEADCANPDGFIVSNVHFVSKGGKFIAVVKADYHGKRIEGCEAIRLASEENYGSWPPFG
ncbi:hypothetical protein KOR42_32200 [Thalassoglobus neptunius]|uniref:Uncharacterized protein n=1 Tax=Thalassoglobus neptunius TaxID=1938619 RepID=A0A5C5WMT5_9PLAN|nr:hypothetical protein KOR42_32200 [Thalassoglobus neptunius]